VIKPLLAVLCALPLAACALFRAPQTIESVTPAFERPALTPVSLYAPKANHNPKTAMRAPARPRALVPCFGASPIANDCRWDSAIDHENDIDAIRADARAGKIAPINLND